MDELEIYEALGIAPPGEGAKAQETADPAAQEEAERKPQGGDSGKAQPAGEGAPENEAAPRGDAPEEDRKDGMSAQQRRENAAQRRRQEQEAAIRQAVTEAVNAERERSKGEWEQFFAQANLKNTITGQPITSKEEFDKWAADYKAAKLQRDLKSGKLTPEALDEAIRNTPTVKRLDQRAEQQDKEAADRRSAEDERVIEAEIAEIHKIDPTINSMEDLLRMPNAKAFYGFVAKGNNFVDAYYLANRERMAENTAQAAKQQAMNAARSKDHLNGPAKPAGGGAIDVPADVMEQYRFLCPRMTDAQIREHYNKNHKE